MPRVMAASAVPTVPAMLMALGAVAVRPPAKFKVSAEASPSFKVPVFKNTVGLTVPVTRVLTPSSSRL